MDQARRNWWETRWFVPVAILLSVAPLLWPAIPPLTDLPGHMGRYRVMLGTDADVLGQWYRFAWRPVGNLGVDLLVAALAPLVGLEPAVKLIVVAIAGTTATGILWIAREAHGRVTPFALFALPLVYNYAFHYGFVNYALSMALALNGFALWLRLGRQGRWRLRAALFVPLSCAVWAAHVMGWGVLGLMVFGAELAARRAEGRGWAEAGPRAVLACLPLALPLAMLLLWRSGGAGGPTNRFFNPIKISWLIECLRDRWRLLDIGSMLVLWGVIYMSLRERGFERAMPVFLACVMLALAFLLLPFMLFGSAYADMRLVPYMAMLALLGVRGGEHCDGRRYRLLAWTGLAFLLVRTGATTVSFWLYDRDYARQLAALDHVPRGARVLALVGDSCEKPWAHSRRNHLPGLAIARRAAFANDQWRLDGSALLTVNAPGMGGFAADPSQRVLPQPCEREWELRSVDAALRGFPRAGFDYLWLIAPPPYDPRGLSGMSPVWRDGGSGLYRIDKSRLSARVPTL